MHLKLLVMSLLLCSIAAATRAVGAGHRHSLPTSLHSCQLNLLLQRHATIEFLHKRNKYLRIRAFEYITLSCYPTWHKYAHSLHNISPLLTTAAESQEGPRGAQCSYPEPHPSDQSRRSCILHTRRTPVPQTLSPSLVPHLASVSGNRILVRADSTTYVCKRGQWRGAKEGRRGS